MIVEIESDTMAILTRRCSHMGAVGRVRNNEDVAHEDPHDLTRGRNEVLIRDRNNLGRVPAQPSCCLGIFSKCQLETRAGDLNSVMLLWCRRNEIAHDIDYEVKDTIRGTEMRVVAKEARDAVCIVSFVGPARSSSTYL